MLHWNRKADTLLLMGEELLCWNCHGELFQLKRMRGQSTWSSAVLPLGDSLLLAGWLCCLNYVPRTALWQAALEESTCPKGKLTLCSAEPWERRKLFVPFLEAWSHCCQFYFALCDTCRGIDKYRILLMVRERAETSLLCAWEQGGHVCVE